MPSSELLQQRSLAALPVAVVGLRAAPKPHLPQTTPLPHPPPSSPLPALSSSPTLPHLTLSPHPPPSPRHQANSLCITKTGLLFAASEFSDHALFQFQSLGEDEDGPGVAHKVSGQPEIKI